MQNSEPSNLERARRLIDECAKSGIKEFCVCAGSRNSPFLSVLAGAEGFKIYSFSDERAASFFALGRIKDSRRPVAVVCTSGTAVAELLPATIEAFYQKQPLVLISADRPQGYRGTGAPQSIDQTRILEDYCELVWDVGIEQTPPNLSQYNFKKPLHINVCFEEPLIDEEMLNWAPEFSSYETSTSLKSSPKDLQKFIYSDSILVLLGAISLQEKEAVKRFLLQLKAPIWAEAISNLREDPDLQPLLIKSGERFLSKVTWKRVLRLGGVPSCRFWRDLETMSGVEVMSVSREGFSGLSRESKHFDASLETALDVSKVTPAPVTDKVFHLDQLFRQQLKLLMGELPLSEVSLLSHLSQRISDLSSVFLGNSLVIREWNLGARFNVGQREYHANRGANGIEGQLSTFFGVSQEKKNLCWGIFGDHTTLYDLNAPWALRFLKRQPRGIVLINNGGGQVFSRVNDLTPLWANPSARSMLECRHEINFEPWAKMWDLDYVRVESSERFRIPQDSFVMELRPDPEQSSQFWRSYQKLWESL
ncbi:2-succinyl-5-enolpyruvyl-6-hydroxy-3-cyclohexene-1-carboxylic-acid synthase [bacterium]|nr:2-succinyl-5-enolpyruvyl-6-hydroxy-3-cyclohexene-1-carboxylic-acid synthase [bacterium]